LPSPQPEQGSRCGGSDYRHDGQVEGKGLQALAAESMGWQPLGQGTYLHHGDADENEDVIHVVGIPDMSMAGMNVLLLT